MTDETGHYLYTTRSENNSRPIELLKYLKHSIAKSQCMEDKWDHSVTSNHTIPSTFKQTLSYIPNPFEENKCLEVEKSFPVVNTPNYTNNFNYSSSKENLLDYFKSSVNQQHFNNRYNLFYLNEWYQSYHERSIFTPTEKDEKPLDLSFKTDSTPNESIWSV
ncbi:unnamed protein product [Schistosoma turkestanicum]|nr:unnamed protein product [Schistosoma turkestanicum]